MELQGKQQGFRTESLGYESSTELFGDSFEFRKIEKFDYEMYYADFVNFDIYQIETEIKNKFKEDYKGDINVKVFSTQNTLQFPSDNIQAAKFNVVVEVVSKIDYEISLDKELLKKLGTENQFFQNLLNFREEITFSKNENGNRDFNHSVSFGIRDNQNNLGQDGRKALAQNIAESVFDSDNVNDYELDDLLPKIFLEEITKDEKSLGYKNYYNETYDLIKNTYSFSRQREILPFKDTQSNITLNNSYSLVMNENGVIEITEKVNSFVRKMFDFENAKSELESHYLDSYSRCNSIYNNFHNDQVLLLNRTEYDSTITLKNIPIKLLKNYNKQSLTLGYSVTYTSSPETKLDDLGLEYILSQTIEFVVDPYNKVEATHSLDYTLNKTKQPDYSFYSEAMRLSENASYIQTYYNDNFQTAASIYPTLKLIKKSASLPNIKTKASVKYNYSNSPIYFVNIENITFKVYEVTIDVKKPVDIINEFKVINRDTRENKSVLSYAYQSEQGQVSIKINATIGKNSKEFSPNFNGFTKVGDQDNLELKSCLIALYKDAGQRFLSNFDNQSFCLNWFISDSNFTFDSSNGNINAIVNYVYTSKMRNGS